MIDSKEEYIINAKDMYNLVTAASLSFFKLSTKPYCCYYFFYDEIIVETKRAILFKVGNIEQWVPKSVIKKLSKKIKQRKYLDNYKDYIKHNCTRVILKDNYFVSKEINKSILLRALDFHGDKPVGKEGFNSVDGEEYTAYGVPYSDIIQQEF